MTDDGIPIEQLGKVTVYDESGEGVQLSRQWAEKPAVLVFVRHFG